MNYADLKIELSKQLTGGYNVLLVGSHGTGKTTIIKEIAAEQGLKTLYWSGPLIDPDTSLGGYPMPNTKTKTVEHYPDTAVQEAEFIFIDELNRAKPEVLQSFFELIQTRSIHGKRLPNLKAVWAAINPPEGEYDVDRLDPALMDRFHVYFQMQPQYSAEYLAKFTHPVYAQAMVEWVTKDVKAQQGSVSPRRMEYLARQFNDGLMWEACLQNPKLPVAKLRERLEAASKLVQVGATTYKPVEKALSKEAAAFLAGVDATWEKNVVKTKQPFNANNMLAFFDSGSTFESYTKALSSFDHRVPDRVCETMLPFFYARKEGYIPDVAYTDFWKLDRAMVIEALQSRGFEVTHVEDKQALHVRIDGFSPEVAENE